MCVDSKGYDWERPAEVADLAVLSKHFADTDFETLLEVMSRDGARPLTTDLVLVGAMRNTAPDALGMCFVPFVGIEKQTRAAVKLPVMTQIVDWFENSALGTDMWAHASDWCESVDGGRFHFAMNCGCGKVSAEARQGGNWTLWKSEFNRSRADIYGKTRIVNRDSNAIAGTDITPAQLTMWYRMRRCLEALPAVAVGVDRQAA